jgi:hypothetical protein
MPIRALYYGIFREKDQKWMTYYSGDKQFPDDNMLLNINTIIIPGSGNSAYDDVDWINDF